jgi:16S rRNA G1207 methylase RsmC
VRLTTDRGVFAAEGIDPGTKLLLLEAPAPQGACTVLDLGCGYGPIAIAVALRAPRSVVWAVDPNERARALCAANAARAGVDARVKVCPPDAVPADVSFDIIYSNPPIRIGKGALHELLQQWLARLTPAGTAYLVVQKHLGADSLARWLADQGWQVTRLVSRRAYRVVAVTR